MDDSRHNSLNSVINEFVKKLLKSRGGPILVGIAYNAYPQIIFPPGLTFLASVFWTFLTLQFRISVHARLFFSEFIEKNLLNKK